MLIRIKKDLKIREPFTKELMTDEKEYSVEDNLFWRRIERDGDIEVLDAPAVPKKETITVRDEA